MQVTWPRLLCLPGKHVRSLNRSKCPISLSLEAIGDRWSLLILRDMIFAGKRSYNAFLASDERIATNILRDRLKALVAAKLLERAPDPENKRRMNYRLTERAIALTPTIIHLGHWGQLWLPTSKPLAAQARRLYQAGPEGWRSLMAKLRREHVEAAR